MPSRVLIVGAGLGGLTLAHCLARHGIPFDIVERAERWETVGAGLGLWSNALRVLERLGLLEAAIAAGQPFTGGSVTDEHGRLITRVDYSRLGLKPLVGVAFLRADLHDVLRAGLDARIRMGTTLAARQGSKVTLSDGSTHAYDLVVGADGVRSRVREFAWGATPLRDAGYTSWRFVVPIEVPPEGAIEMWGRGKRVGLVPIGRGRTYFFSALNVPRDFLDPVEGRLSRFRDRFREFGGHFARGLAAVQRDEELIHARLEEVRLAKWTGESVALLGDAAHAMTPNLAQGAAMAIEDAWVLADCLAGETSLPAAFERYERERRSRVRWVQDQSWRFGILGQLESPVACALRNAAMRIVPASAAARHLVPLLRGGPC